MNQEINQEAKSTAPGTLFGVGVGPGDPELLTIKAIRVLERCPVVAYPRTRGENSLALDIVRRAGVDLEGKRLLPLLFPMTKEKEALRRYHDEAAGAVMAELRAGSDVAMPSLGDASLYSTFSYVLARVKEAGLPVQVVPGVPSFCAAAASFGRSLTAMREPLHIIPAGYEGSLQALSLPGSKVVMKSGRTLPELCARLDELGLLERSSLAENVGLPGERMVPAMTRETESAGYFTTVMVWPEEKEGQL